MRVETSRQQAVGRKQKAKSRVLWVKSYELRVESPEPEFGLLSLGSKGSRQQAKSKGQRPETGDQGPETANSKVAFRSHSSRQRSSVIRPGVYTLCAERYAPGAESRKQGVGDRV